MKKIFIIMLMIIVISSTLVSVEAAKVHLGGVAGDTVDSVPVPGYDENLVDDQLRGTTANIWATVTVIVRVVAVACVVFAGIRYMFSSADQKADVKQGLIYLAIGATLVFAATYVINFVVGAANEIL